MMDISVILVDDHNVMRRGLRILFERETGMLVVGEADNGLEAVELTGKLHPDIVIMDVTMPDMNGVEATRQIVKQSPDVKVLALSAHCDKRFVIAMLKAGAAGYLLKKCAFGELITAIQTVVAGQVYLSPVVANVVVEELNTPPAQNNSSTRSVLTNREREILQPLVEGKTVKEIAGRLHISISTVETHRRKIMEKLDLHSVSELTKYAIREGITSLED